MAGPAQQETFQFLVPIGESDRLYAPSQLAGRIVNMRTTPEGTLESIPGPAPWIPDRGNGYPVIGEPHGIFWAGLLGGMADTLLLRAGTQLFRYAGWNRGWESIASGLTNERRPCYPDQFLALGDKIVWTNGIDRARLVTHDGQVVPLGFEAAPAAPEVDGPADTGSDTADSYLPNALGYSWWGSIGDAAQITDAQSGWLLAGAWTYRAQLEDEFGNLSPLSSRSSPVSIASMFFSPLPDDSNAAPGVDVAGTTMDDHTRSFLIRQVASGIDHAVAVRWYRTMNMRLHGNVDRYLGRHESRGRCQYPDGRSDALLGAVAQEIAPVPVFRVMTAHNGSLVIGNFPNAPGLVRKAMAGFPGTFPLDWIARPDSGGAEVTGMASHAGVLLLGTDSSIYAAQDVDSRPPTPIARGIGIAAPRSLQALPDGTLIWLSFDGFYGLPPGRMDPVRLSSPIHRLVRDGVSSSRLRLATSAVDPLTGTYICTLAPAGRTRNRLQLCYDGAGWRRYDMGLSLADIATINDWRGYVLGCGMDGATDHVFALHREVQNYTPPARTAIFRSAWLTADETGSVPVRVRKIYVRLVDASNADISIRFYRDGSYVPVDTQADFRSIGMDTAEDNAAPIARNPVSDIAGSAVIGTARVHARRASWRSVTPNGLEDAYSWAFELQASYPTRMHLAAFAFDVAPSGSGDPRGRIPRHADV